MTEAELEDAASAAFLLKDTLTHQRIEESLGRTVIGEPPGALRANETLRKRCVAAHSKARELLFLGVPLSDLEDWEEP